MPNNELGPILDELPELLNAEAGIVMEPTNRELHAGCQGSINARVSFLGEAAHSARPWLGVNAISRAGEFLQMMDALEPELHPIEGLPFKEVISVTRASGGVANNIIPSRFDLNVNYRRDVIVQDPAFPYVNMAEVRVEASYESLGMPAIGTHGGGTRLIDYVSHLRRNVITPLSQQILRGYASDHRPVLVEYQLKGFRR